MKWSLMLLVAASAAGIAVLPSVLRSEERGREGGGSVEGVMKSVHGKRGLMKTLEPMLDAKDPDWAAIQALTKKIEPLAASLGKRKPKKGPKESWVDLSDIYADNAKELAAAAAKKDIEGTKTYFGEFNSGCTKCHKIHRGGGD